MMFLSTYIKRFIFLLLVLVTFEQYGYGQLEYAFFAFDSSADAIEVK